MSQQAVSTVTATALPEAGTYVVDPAHASVEFVSRHLMVARVRGRFGEFTGSVTVGDSPETSSAEASIVTASIDTRQEQRDEHLKSPDFLDVENFPSMDFRSTSIEQRGDGAYLVTGDLTVRGVSRPIELDAEYLGALTDPWGNPRIVFSARAEVDREAFGMTWNQTLETGGVLVGKKVAIEIEAELVKQQ